MKKFLSIHEAQQKTMQCQRELILEGIAEGIEEGRFFYTFPYIKIHKVVLTELEEYNYKIDYDRCSATISWVDVNG